MRYAIIDQAGNVENVIDLDEPASFPVAEGYTLRPADFNAEPGGRFIDGKFEREERIAPALDTRPLAMQTIERLEQENPITHRGQREFYLGFGAAFPQFQETHLYKEAKRVDDAIRAERAKL